MLQYFEWPAVPAPTATTSIANERV